LNATPVHWADISRAVLVGALRSVRDSPTNPALSPPSVRCECSRGCPRASWRFYHQRHRGVSQAGWQIMGQLQAPLLDAVKTALEAAMVRRRRQLLRGSDCSTTYLQSQIYVTQ
jgi:hypothetical protein